MKQLKLVCWVTTFLPLFKTLTLYITFCFYQIFHLKDPQQCCSSMYDIFAEKFSCPKIVVTDQLNTQNFNFVILLFFLLLLLLQLASLFFYLFCFSFLCFLCNSLLCPQDLDLFVCGHTKPKTKVSSLLLMMFLSHGVSSTGFIVKSYLRYFQLSP